MREELLKSLDYLSISGAVIMTFTVLLIVFRKSGFSAEVSILFSALSSLAVLVVRIASTKLKK